MAKLEWGRDNVQLIQSLRELEAIVTQLEEEAASEPFMIELFIDGAGSISIGLGSDLSVVNLTPVGGNPPYHQSYGAIAGNEIAPTFMYGGALSEFPEDSAIPAKDALEAMRYFFAHGRASPNLRWREV